MKAISIRQPWASLIIAGIKPVENRKWKSTYTGPLLIHASQRFDKNSANYLMVHAPKARKIIEESYDLRGGIIGKVEMTDCVKEHPSWWFQGPYGFIVKNPEKIDFYECRGQLGFFDVPWPPEMNDPDDKLFYLNEFRSEQCQCGLSKQSRRSFCYTCFKRLPEFKQKALFQRFGEGYEEAYDDAVKWLNG